jgi:CrcB protein
MASHVLLVAAGGALGAVSRYGLGLLAVRVWGTGLPIGTWAVNLLGSFLIGVALPFIVAKGASTEGVRLAFVIGFLGSFTTFSTFSLDTYALWERGHSGWALANAGGSVALGLGCVVLGLWLGRWLA